MKRTWLVLFVIFVLSHGLFSATWSKWNNITVGSTAGNIGKWNNNTIGTTTGNIGAWNGLTSPGGGGGGTIAVDKFCIVNNNAGTGGAQTCSFGGNTAAGDGIVAIVMTASGFARGYTVATTGTSQSLTDDSPAGGCTASNSTGWVLTWSAGNAKSCGFSLNNASANATGCTFTPSGADYFVGVCAAFTNMYTAGALKDVVGTVKDNGVNSGGTWQTNATGTLAQAHELILAIGAEPYGNSLTIAATGFSQIGTTQGGTAAGTLSVFWKEVNSTATSTPAGTDTGTPNYRINGIAYTLKGN